ncbi:MAG TPA: hypothetical protein VFL45_07475 [Gammaproteobacteria bacterium]|nr:hypothetical protein [Gammaproteobacteria bacterium]
MLLLPTARVFRGALLPLALITAGLAALPSAAQAAEYKVYSPYVVLGESEIEARTYFNQDDLNAVDGTGALKLAYGHAFTDFWATEIYAEVEHEEGETEIEAIEWENRFQLTPQGKYWADVGLLAEAEFATESGHPHELKFGPLIEKSFGRMVATVNLYVEREIGPNAEDETELGYAARLRYRLNPQFEPSLEIYGSPGEVGEFAPKGQQRHQIGPGFYGQVHLSGARKIKYSAAVLYGITDTGSPNWTYVVRFEYEFF